ncbi:hypothetical protein BJP34_23485 [Moorena producens PAL-8-15-08-1]|uniref:eCIS core domain-containing protein n=1 Tax=Moorena producens PAL-8-15-08-1 TaxID=1458985 RepID=A0A1D8TX07_9CYAN|nr:DUF4157 domain-containing protein [Moorena producens]AOX01996.1 hypothetical protein BJP34_23485 [Moorena producens PAL-8-15-08-1]
MVRRQFVHRKHQEPQKKSDDSWILQRSAVRRVPTKTQESQKSKDSWILQRSAVHEVPAKNLRQPPDFVVRPNLRQPPDFVVRPNLRQPPDFVVKPNKGIQVDLTQIPVRNYSETPFQPRMRSHLQVQQLVTKDGSAKQQEEGRSDIETPVQRQEDKRETENKTGLPDHLKEGIERLSGYNLSGVRVNYNSPKPAQLNAHAYTQGQSIEVAPGQERHVPHEAWHVVQQMQGRVKEEFKMNGVKVNGNRELEREADAMGGRAEKSKLKLHRSTEGKKQRRFPTSRNIRNFKTRMTKICKKDNSDNQEQLIVQRVNIGDKEIKSNSTIEDIKSALKWNGFQIGLNNNALNKNEWKELLNELNELIDKQNQEKEELLNTIIEDIEWIIQGLEDKEGQDENFDKQEQDEELDDVDEFDNEKFKNKMAAIVNKFGWDAFPEETKKLQLLGVHQTDPKNVTSLVENGPDQTRIGQGHGSGKGEGFYVTPVKKKQNLLKQVTAMDYGEGLVAVYVPKTFEELLLITTLGQNVDEMEQDEDKDSWDYYITEKRGEIIIPPRNFEKVKIVIDPKVLEFKQKNQNKKK